MAEQLVLMRKGEETMYVHPLCVEEHKGLGWVVVDEAPTAKPAKPAKPEKVK